ncbi:Disease resistance protein RGA2 [Linum perenne]
MGGLGKTTLAQLVFDDKQVHDFFAVKVWVYVSQSFDVKVILEKMLQSITREDRMSLELDVLQAQLREKITGKRFLFVLDDVWEENVHSWENLGKFLAVGSPGSKVLVTTRSSEVAKIGVVLPYFLEGLSPTKSWDLFVKKAFNGKLAQNTYLEKIGREVLGKCHGVPLAISTVSGLLSSKNTEIEWQLFLENVLKSNNDIMSTLKLSYNHLLPHMKRCFAYCKLFPKGHMFDVPSLVQFWVSQRYVESEDDGLDCFKKLWWRSFFQEVEMDEFGSIISCKMHDMIHDLVESITGEKILRISSLSDVKNITSMTRHLTLLKEEENGDPELGNVSKIRTLICVKFFTREQCARVIHNFKRLRVLVMLVEGSDSDSDASIQLQSLSKLKHLRYLYLGCEGMERLPDSITNLHNLQVIGVASNRFKELPKDIIKLVNLKHLYIRYNISMAYVEYFARMPKGTGELTSLQTIPVFMVDKRSDFNVWMELDDLRGLNALRGELIIRNLADVELVGDGVYFLNGKLLLQSLILDWGRIDDEEYEELVATPMSTHDEDILEMLCPHPNLKKLEIRDGYLGLKLPNWLSSITNLVEISLEDFEGELRLWRVSAEILCPTMKMKPVAMILPLSKLTHLTIWDIVDLEFLPEEGLCNLTSLKELVIVSCPKLGYLPPEMRHLTSLRTLVILSCPHLTERCRKGEGEDWLNICHIAKIVLDREIVQDSGESEASVVDDPLASNDDDDDDSLEEDESDDKGSSILGGRSKMAVDPQFLSQGRFWRTEVSSHPIEAEVEGISRTSFRR